MKLLFITSTYKGIYTHFESWIVSELGKKHEVQLFNVKSGLPALQSLCKTFHPEIAVTLVGFKLPLQMIQWLQSQKVKTAVWFTEDPYFMDRTSMLARYYDFVFTIDTAAQEYYRLIGIKHAHHLPLATEPLIYKPKEVEESYKSDVCMVGFPYPGRVHFIRSLLQQSNYRILVAGKWRRHLMDLKNHPNLTIHEGWVDPTIAANYYNGAKIVLNTHRPFNLKENENRLGVKGKSINNRTFDAAACGAFQLIESKDDLPTLFKEGQEMVSFSNFENLLEKIDYYITHDEERKRIAHNARTLVLKEHTFDHRLQQMFAMIHEADD